MHAADLQTVPSQTSEDLPMIFLAFLLLVSLEIASVAWVGSLIDSLPLSIWMAVGTSLVGLALVNRFRNAAANPEQFMQRLNAGSGLDPINLLAPLAGAILLVIPGFFTDLLGLLLIVPMTRSLLRKPLARLMQVGVRRAMAGGLAGTMPGGAPPPDLEALRRQWEGMNGGGSTSRSRSSDGERGRVKDADFTIRD